MPIRQLLDSNAFNPEEVTILRDVFEDTLRALKLHGSQRPGYLAHREEDNRTRAPRGTRAALSVSVAPFAGQPVLANSIETVPIEAWNGDSVCRADDTATGLKPSTMSEGGCPEQQATRRRAHALT